MNFALPVSVVLCTISVQCFAFQEPQEKVIERFSGHWNAEEIIETSDGKKTSTTYVTRGLLSKQRRMVLLAEKRKNGGAIRMILSYEPSIEKYAAAYFDGRNWWDLDATWDEHGATMEFDFKLKTDSEISYQLKHRFIDLENAEVTMVEKNSNGRMTRKKAIKLTRRKGND